VIHSNQPGATINKNIYGQFAEHLGRLLYQGLWVGEDSPIPNTHGIRNDVLAALKELHVPVLRWPGGCFADEYHWRDGIGPRDKRPKRPNASWGGVDTNAFGTHEFLDLCEMLGAEAYINGNVGSGSPQASHSGGVRGRMERQQQGHTGPCVGASSSSPQAAQRTSLSETRRGVAAARCVPSIMPMNTVVMPHL